MYIECFYVLSSAILVYSFLLSLCVLSECIVYYMFWLPCGVIDGDNSVFSVADLSRPKRFVLAETVSKLFSFSFISIVRAL